MHSDTRHTGGATASVSRRSINMYYSQIERLKTNVDIPALGTKIYFFPDALFYRNGNGEILSILYEELEIKLSTVHNRETDDIPSDSKKIGSTQCFIDIIKNR
jgi:hypothetical protein